MTRYAIRNIHLFSAFRFGCLVGGVLMLPIGLLLGLLVRALVGFLRDWLETWEKLSLDLAGQTLAGNGGNGGRALVAARGAEAAALRKLTTNWRTLIEEKRGTLI